MYADNPLTASKALVYGDVAVMFLFQGFYSIGWTPLLTLYPPEVLNFSIRANGVAGTSFALNAFAYVPPPLPSSSSILTEGFQSGLRIHNAHRSDQHHLEDVLRERLLGYCYSGHDHLLVG